MHLDLDWSLLPADHVLVTIDLDALSVEQVEAFPEDTVAFGDAWIAAGRSAVLSVPSAIVPESRNLLLDPAHSEAARAHVASIRPFAFDERPWLRA